MSRAQAVFDNFRAQWVYEPPPVGFVDVPWIFSYALPQPGDTLPLLVDDFPLAVDDDAEFRVRGLWARDMASVAYSGSALLVRLRDAYGNRLADDLQPLYTLFSNADHRYGSARNMSRKIPAPLEPELIVPASGLLVAQLFCPAANQGDVGANVTLYLVGVKRYVQCAGGAA